MCKNLSDPKYPTRTFFDPTRPVRKSWPVAPQRLHNCGTNCIQWGYFHWPYQFLIAFLYLDTDIFVNELVRFVHVLTKLCLKTESCIMAELICILWATCLWLNQFLIAFIVFLDHENIGFVALFIRFGHVLAELCLKNEFFIMAELICILCKMLKGARMASTGFLI